MSETDFDEHQETDAIAVVGMAGRFPGAADLNGFWENLRDGKEGITFFSTEELRALGVPESSLGNPNFVPAAPVLEDIDLFDAGFFGYTPREAQMLDPQHRLFLETAHAALESAGYDPEAFPGLIGIYGGTSMSTYMLFNILTNPRFAGPEDEFPAMIGNDKDFLTTRVAYHLNLRGPSLDVQTGCSTSLVATHLACEALHAFQCDMALAGGVSVNVPQRTGYFYEEGGITSPDGHCRAFDAQGGGTLFGSGVGVVVLKRLEDALADGDRITALIRASAVNNDGSHKVGYTAPGMDGQTEVIARALSLAEVSPETIDYVETHGTGTALGDPVEVGALTAAFRAETEARGYCALGAVKSNIGHLDAAAGVAGLIKTCLSLEHAQIPPSLHFENPNPKLELESSPFYVNDHLRSWPKKDRPRRAAVSSFGIGGTNAHLILEEAPPPKEGGSPAHGPALLLLSARDEAALEAVEENLGRHLEAHPEIELADVAYTLQVGRKRHPFRSVVVAADVEEAVAALRSAPPAKRHRVFEEGQARRCVFMFPGGGVQHLGMGADLYDREAVFREHMDECALLLRPLLDEDLVAFLYGESDEDQENRIQGTVLALPALFTIEYACARLLMSWGLRPAAVIGHSMGEYVAACLAGVFTLEDALAVVVKRGKLFDELPSGGMCSVPLAAEEVRPLLGDRLAFAAVNSPGESVISGPVDALEAFMDDMRIRGVETRRLKIDVAAHSPMIDLILPRFTQFMKTLPLNEPSLPLIANVTGTWMTAEQARDPGYWGLHLRQTVQFGAGVRTLLEEPDFVFLEVGPGRTLSSLAKLQQDREQHHRFLASMRHPMDRVDDGAQLLSALGKLWAAGVDIDGSAFYEGERRRRLLLPTYPFQRQRYWIEPGEGRAAASGAGDAKLADVGSWTHVPSWQRLSPPPPPAEPDLEGVWLIFDDGRLGRDLAERLASLGVDFLRVTPGHVFVSEESYSLRPGIRADYDALIRELDAAGRTPRKVLHCWGMIGAENGFAATTDLGFYSLLFLQQALDAHGKTDPLSIHVFTHGLFEVESSDLVNPDLAPLLGPCLVIPQEHPHVSIRVLDLDRPFPGRQNVRLDHLLAEVLGDGELPMTAWRGPHRWALGYQPLSLPDPGDEPVFAAKGRYLITGGLGGIGLLLARHLAESCGARLTLTSRSGLPPRETWESILADGDAAVRAKVSAIQELEALGAEVLVCAADVTDLEAMESVLEESERRFGKLDGVVHAAGLAGASTVKTAVELDRDDCAALFAAKVSGTRVLYQVLRSRTPDFVLLLSSNVTLLGGLGATAYAAANSFLDAFAATWPEMETRWISTNWDGWLLEPEAAAGAVRTSIDHLAMTPAESTAVFSRIVAGARVNRVIVSTGDLESRYDRWIRRRGVREDLGDGVAVPRPLKSAVVPPENELQELILEIWAEQLGIRELGIHDNFFDLGGNSLIALKLAGRLEKTLQVKVPVVSLFEAPTIETLAALLGGREEPAEETDAEGGHGQRRRERRRERRRRQLESEVHH